MCGLIGALLAESSLTGERIVGALATIAHRGPDHTSWWRSSDHRMVLGHVRLSVIGLDNGDQPLSSWDGEVRCVVNGELYGYPTIREELRVQGWQFASDSDSEIALHLYQRLGDDFVHQLRGEFAVVIADQRRRRLIAVRDRFGIKPLFYTVRGSDVLIASEIKALLALGVPARGDGQAFFAECRNVRTADHTLFAGIRAVPPGCMLVTRDGQVDIRSYWDTIYPSREAQAADGRSEVEVVADERYNEEKLAQHAADWVGATFTPVPVHQHDLAEAFSEALWHAETLIFNGQGMAKYLLSRAVRNAGIKVVFTGDGADEILAGYPPFRRDLLLHSTEQQPPEDADKRLAELYASNQAWQQLYTTNGPNAPGLDAFTTHLGWIPTAIETFSTLAASMYPLFTDVYPRAGLRANPYTELLNSLDVPGRLVGRDRLNQALYLWIHTMLSTFILTVLGDSMEMAHSVEGRVPFLDHHVADYAAQIPVHHKIRGKSTCCAKPFATACRQPFFDPRRVRSLMDRVAAMQPADRAALDSIIMRIVSTCLLQQRFGLGT